MNGLLGWVNSPADLTAADLRSLPPAEKARIIEAMGFTPMGELHTPECPSWLSGHRCNCVPAATVWTAPEDVLAHRRETWDERYAAATARNARRE